jgi:C4-dicarboxylate transporter DctM subunit
MGVIVLITFVLALLLAVPVAMSLGIAALVGILYVSPDILILLPQKFVTSLDSFPLLAIPLFILAGSLMTYGGIARRIIDMSLAFVGRIPGGLGFVVVVSTFFFGAICGSSSAKTAAIGSVMLPEMVKKKYPPEFATALFAAAGGGSVLVPPSIDLIIIGVVANISITGLFAAGIIPTVVNGIALMILVYIFAKKLNLPLAPKMNWSEKMVLVKSGSLPVLMVVIVLGGIYGGIFTPTEASAVAVVYGFCLSFFVYKELSLKDLQKSLLHTGALTGVVLLVLAMAGMFSAFLTFERIPHELALLITRYADNWIVFLIFVNVVFLFIGMVMDALPAIIVLVPIIIPVGVALGLNPIHLGILIEANVGLGMITPPVGVTLYVACGISKIPIEQVIKPSIPFIIFLFISLMIISYVPEITLFLPRLLGFIN